MLPLTDWPTGLAPAGSDRGLTADRLAEIVRRFSGLTPIEHETARLMADEGLCPQEVAERRGVRPATVRNMLTEVYRRLGIDRTVYGHPRVVLVRGVWASGLVTQAQGGNDANDGRDRGQQGGLGRL